MSFLLGVNWRKICYLNEYIVVVCWRSTTMEIKNRGESFASSKYVFSTKITENVSLKISVSSISRFFLN